MSQTAKKSQTTKKLSWNSTPGIGSYSLNLLWTEPPVDNSVKARVNPGVNQEEPKHQAIYHSVKRGILRDFLAISY